MIFRSDDGTLIYCESHRLPKARGAILIVHGMGEHSGRYSKLVKECNKLGLVAHLMDLRGHGRSQGIRGHFTDIEEHHRDIEAWMDHLVQKRELNGDLPLFLFGHSLGGLIAATFAAQYKEKPLYPALKGMILSSPAFGLRANLIQALEGKIAKRLPSFLRNLQVPTGIRAEDLSHDKEAVLKYKNDPLVHPWITPAAYLAINRAIRKLPKLIPQLGIQTLFLLSGKDKVVHFPSAEALAQKLAVAHSGMIEVKVFHSFFHEPFHEAKKERAYLEFKKWVLQCLSPRKAISSKKSSSKSSGKKATERANLH
jgi:alpha-beta hydrolase superfamily lysophospholipase